MIASLLRTISAGKATFAGPTTMRDELGAPPDRAMLKAHLVANLTRRLDAEPQEDRMSDEESAAIAIAAERLVDAARRD
jgi:hypothetical protein